MSDYFGALMRLSGLAGSDARTTPGALVERPAPAAVAEVTPASGLSITQASDEQPSSPPMLNPHARHAPESAMRAEPAADVALHRKPTDEDAVPVDPIDHRNVAIRAAMRWVAADPAQRSVDAEIRAQAPHSTELADLPASALDGNGQQAPGASDAPGEAPHTADSTVRLAPAHAAVLARADSRPEPTPAGREEVIEVSIGAIHVRVDAPAEQTQRSPASLTAPSAAVATEPRSTLSRRALRRI